MYGKTQINFLVNPIDLRGFPGGASGKESACNARDPGLIPGSGRSPGEGNDYPFQYLAWRIPWAEEPDELQCMGSQELDTTE